MHRAHVPYLKTYYKLQESRAWHCPKEKRKCTRTEIPELETYIYGQLILTKVAIQFSGERKTFNQMALEQMDIQVPKWALDPCTACKNNSQCITD